jgi:hypothetical protein
VYARRVAPEYFTCSDIAAQLQELREERATKQHWIARTIRIAWADGYGVQRIEHLRQPVQETRWEQRLVAQRDNHAINVVGERTKRCLQRRRLPLVRQRVHDDLEIACVDGVADRVGVVAEDEELRGEIGPPADFERPRE